MVAGPYFHPGCPFLLRSSLFRVAMSLVGTSVCRAVCVLPSLSMSSSVLYTTSLNEGVTSLGRCLRRFRGSAGIRVCCLRSVVYASWRSFLGCFAFVVAVDEGDSRRPFFVLTSVPAPKLSSFCVRPHPLTTTREGAKFEMKWAARVRGDFYGHRFGVRG